MKNTKVLEMIESGQIEELKAELRDEIYTESLKGRPDAKKRYAAMKKYFTYVTSVREALQKPCNVEFNGIKYTSFCNSYSLVLTKEDCGELEVFDKPERYPDVTRLIHHNGKESEIDFNKVIAEAKSLGYKLKKSEVGFDFKYVMHYDGSYFKVGLIDSTYGVINDGQKATVYHVESSRQPLTIINDLGIAVVMPVTFEDDGTKIIIDVK